MRNYNIPLKLAIAFAVADAKEKVETLRQVESILGKQLPTEGDVRLTDDAILALKKDGISAYNYAGNRHCAYKL